VWDDYRCNLSEATKNELKCRYNITAAVIPSRCTKYFEAPDSLGTSPLKQLCMSWVIPCQFQEFFGAFGIFCNIA